MTTPTLVTVSGTVYDVNGPVAGRLVFRSTTEVAAANSSDVMLPQEIVAIAGVDGVISVPIPATNDPAWSPTGWAWEVRPHFPNWKTPFQLAVAFDTPNGVLELSKLVDLPPDGTAALYALVNHTHEGGGGGGGPSASSSVVASTSFAQTSAVGVATTYSRGDHRHGTPAAPTAASVGADPAGTSTSAIAAHVAAGDPHSIYLTQTEGDARYLQPGSFARVLVLDSDDPVPGGTPAGTVIVRTT